jgi:peptidoglycan/LPS O-acetylase OafA/YrhL
MPKLKPYFFTIDLLRGVTALLVCLYHFINHEDANGSLFAETDFIRERSYVLVDSVYVFFMISGFVIPLSMIRQKFTIDRFFKFLLRRWIRIEIPYLFSIIAILFIGFLWSVKGNQSFQLDSNQLFHHFFYTTGIFEKQWLNPIYWTLALEFQFYILIALVFPLVVSKNYILRYSSFLILASFGFLFEDTRFVLHFFPLFLTGLAYLFYSSETENKILNLSLLAALLIQIGFVFSPLTSIYILIALLIIEFGSLTSKNITVKFGKMGYSFYLMHGVFGGSFLYFILPYADTILMKIVFLILAIIISIILSYLFHRIIEKPSHKISQKINYKKTE